MDDTASKRGRTAAKPEQIPAMGWWDIFWRVLKRLGSDNIMLVSAGLALYALLSVFPGLAAAVSIYGLFATPADVVKQMKVFSGILPPGVWNIFTTQLHTIASHEQSTLTVAAGFGLVLALWSARSAMSALMTATNIAYGEHETRPFLVQILISLALTVAALVGFLTMLLLGVAIPVTLTILGTRPWVQWVADAVQWIVLWFFTSVALTVVYRYAPARTPARWHWVTWGSTIAATLWLVMSALFAVYVRSFANYGKTYGALGSVIALLMWFYFSSALVVFGAQINAEMERQTKRDTTQGPEAPMGQRGAYAADTLGPTSDEKPGVSRDEPV